MSATDLRRGFARGAGSHAGRAQSAEDRGIVRASTAGSLLAGRYQLEVPLGRGGFGRVWRAMDVALRRPVAVKLVELTEITDPALLAETIARFRREATTIAALRDQNIVTAYDSGRVGSEL